MPARSSDRMACWFHVTSFTFILYISASKKMGFKVIIVGGGLSGLGLAHCLTKAGIDFIVLERSDLLVPKGGASMALWPNNVRLLDQLGLLKGAEEIDCGIKYKQNVRRDGSVLQKSNMMERVGVA
jgi:2-polyprenyl-6-methoxyphenol hydroxylase-like FAD-dependent oxidoreductase